MSADTLRRAAAVLRERAEAAYTEKARTPYSDPEIPPVSKAEWGALVDDYLGGVIGAYCATMHPGVGLIIADWLGVAARRFEKQIDTPAVYDHPIALARLILGEAS